jgi:hypothetical protein
MFKWTEPRADDAGFVQHLDCALVSLDMQLIPRPALERTTPIRADLGRDAEAS